MIDFSYTRAADLQGAVSALAGDREARPLGGGTNLLDLMKYGVEQPRHLIDINRLQFSKIEPLGDGGLRIGALARNSDMANHPVVRQNYPALSQALLSGASPQLRNAATGGGNLMQRTRCYYFYDVAFEHCNKRKPGSGCAALTGINRIHAILGASEHCIATNPSDMNVALAALEANIQLQGPKGTRTVPIAEFHRLPGDTPHIDANLEQGEIITAIDLPAIPAARNSYYLKVRERSSYAFALVSVAAYMDVHQGRIRSARIALGGVAHKPWRVPEAEQLLIGKVPGAEAYRAAAERIVQGAKPYEHNAFKVELAKRSVVRALIVVEGRT